MGDEKIELTGNLFVDTGLGVIATLAGLDSIDQLTLEHMKKVYVEKNIADWNSKLKSYTMLFGTNGLLYQASYRSDKRNSEIRNNTNEASEKKNKGPSEQNKRLYSCFLKSLLANSKPTGQGDFCLACGKRTNFNLRSIWNDVLTKNGEKLKNEKFIGRDLFPLIGSIGNDAQALPSASVAPHICARCLFAVQYLPAGVILMNGKLVVFQSSSVEFWYDLVHQISDDIQKRIYAGQYETIGKQEKNMAIMHQLVIVSREYQKKIRGEIGSLYLWQFSNSGASANCVMQEIPNPVLNFFGLVAALRGQLNEIKQIVGGKSSFFLDCVIQRKDCNLLYPNKKSQGATPELFCLYQNEILNRSPNTLNTALRVVKSFARNMDDKAYLKFLKSKHNIQRMKLQGEMLQLAQKGEFVISEYLSLFGFASNESYRVGWKTFQYCLYHRDIKSFHVDGLRIENDQPAVPDQNLAYIALLIFNSYSSKRGAMRFERDVLSMANRGKLYPAWLKNQFLILAENHSGVDYGLWTWLSEGNVYDTIFQMRLMWHQWLNLSPTELSHPLRRTRETGFSEETIDALTQVVEDCISARGAERFRKDILARLRSNELGLWWFQKRLKNKLAETQKWDEGIFGGSSDASERSELHFKLTLAITNAYLDKTRGVSNG